jgi:hypothetical protein
MGIPPIEGYCPDPKLITEPKTFHTQSISSFYAFAFPAEPEGPPAPRSQGGFGSPNLHHHDSYLVPNENFFAFLLSQN